MKKIAIFANDQDISTKIAKDLLLELDLVGLQVIEEGEIADYIVSIGGDGTLLSAFHHFQKQIEFSQFIGIHTGHLGFYTDWMGHEIKQVVASILANEEESVSYPLLDVQINMMDGSKKTYLALNECTLRSHRKTMVCHVNINDRFFETFRGDGLCVATPTGSTGMNKSLGGAVIHPCLDAIQMTEMASVNNRIYRTLSSPIVLPPDEWFDLELAHQEEPVDLTIDNLFWSDQTVRSIRLQLSKKRIQFASFRHRHYWDRVEEAFLGNKLEHKE
ncbi:NAD kinase [Facklamia sp. DSM 111018]|uniref:NAD kinase n=1 Tax=Facklamia lactis TaxID=2749967 RepID=A0ABS0LRE2_9LACT|nr:NAD kinase [Facklamia lactis]MBG9980900.1 NAD kinase [Facklamia lactis]MBG9986737.1 NAD kinase [Facklamia lactis]